MKLNLIYLIWITIDSTDILLTSTQLLKSLSFFKMLGHMIKPRAYSFYINLQGIYSLLHVKLKLSKFKSFALAVPYPEVILLRL